MRTSSLSKRHYSDDLVNYQRFAVTAMNSTLSIVSYAVEACLLDGARS